MYFRLKEIGMPQTSSLKVLSYAARYQAAVRTITVWQENLVRLNQARNENAPCGWLAGDVHSNSWWDTPPAVDYINEASKAFDNKFGDLGKETRNIMRKDKTRGLQSAAASCIHKQLFQTDFASEVKRRLLLWMPCIECHQLEERIRETIEDTRHSKPVFMSAIMMTWLNGWTTSFRAHSHKRNCIFGCGDANDRLLHYVDCPLLWKAIYKMMDDHGTITPTRTLCISRERCEAARGKPSHDVFPST